MCNEVECFSPTPVQEVARDLTLPGVGASEDSIGGKVSYGPRGAAVKANRASFAVARKLA